MTIFKTVSFSYKIISNDLFSNIQKKAIQLAGVVEYANYISAEG